MATREQRQVWTFSTSGWLFCYHFGVVKALKEYEMHMKPYVIGSSGGACAGTYLFLDASISGTMEYIQECAKEARSSWANLLAIKRYALGAIEKFSPARSGEQLTGNLEVSVTTLPWLRNARVKAFSSNDEVASAILASSCIIPFVPVWVSQLSCYCIDGAFSDFQLLKGVLLGRSFVSMQTEDAISVSPFYMSRADIKPSRYVPPWWAAVPPEPEKLKDVFELGYQDAVAWLQRNRHQRFGMMDVEAGSSCSIVEGPDPIRKAQNAVSHVEADVAWGVKSMGYMALNCVAWLLICLELLLLLGMAATTLLVSPTLEGVSTKGEWQRVTRVAGVAAISVRSLLSSCSPSSKEASRQAVDSNQFSRFSLMYRLFQHFL